MSAMLLWRVHGDGVDLWFPKTSKASAFLDEKRATYPDAKISLVSIPTTAKKMCDFLNHYSGLA